MFCNLGAVELVVDPGSVGFLLAEESQCVQTDLQKAPLLHEFKQNLTIGLYPVVAVHVGEEELVCRHNVALTLDAVKPGEQ